MEGRKIIIDADPGLGDAVAIALALSDPNLDVVGLTACGGAVTGEQAFRNLQTIVSMIDPQRWPRIGWSSQGRTMLPESCEKSGMLLNNGLTGLGECDVIEALPHAPTDSAKVLSDLVKEYPGEITILTLGPLTNLQNAVKRHPGFLEQVREIFCYGGTLQVIGNVTAASEFNFYADPDSARDVLTSAITKTMIPHDIAVQFELTFDQYDAFQLDPYTRLGTFLTKSVPYLFRQTRQQLGQEGIFLPEVASLSVVSQQRLMERHHLPVQIEVTGELTRGMSVIDRRRSLSKLPGIEVVTELDLVGVREYFSKISKHTTR